MDYNVDATVLATGGSDHYIRLYDEATKSELAKMKEGGDDMPGHSNRIYCIKWNPNSKSILASGGWDKTV
jgi:WD40 repeat protein